MDNKFTNQLKNDETSQFFRFQVFHGKSDESGKVTKTKSVGMAYLKEGQSIFTLRLWMFSLDRYYLLPNKLDPSKYLVMTREPNKNPQAKNKYYWNIVGSGFVDSIQGFIRLEFDLLGEPIFVNIHPESSAHSANLPEPIDMLDAA